MDDNHAANRDHEGLPGPLHTGPVNTRSPVLPQHDSDGRPPIRSAEATSIQAVAPFSGDTCPAISLRQGEVLEWLIAETLATLVQPSLDEAADHFGRRSRYGVHLHLRALERKGYVLVSSGRSRAVRISARAWRWFCERHPEWPELVMRRAPILVMVPRGGS